MKAALLFLGVTTSIALLYMQSGVRQLEKRIAFLEHPPEDSAPLVDPISCMFDNPAVSGDYVTVSITQSGRCHDAGPLYPKASIVIGRVFILKQYAPKQP